jgi:hypothetical protein
MKINHVAIKSSIFELVKSVEVDIEFSDEHSWTSRIEILRDTEDPNCFRCRVFESELFRMTPSFPRNESHEPAHVTDETLFVERGIARSEIASRMNKSFRAIGVEEAIELVISDLTSFLEYVTGKKAQ